MKLEELLVEMKVNNDQYRREMNEATNITQNKTHQMGNMFKNLRRTIVALGIAKVIKDSIGFAFEEMEAQAKLTEIMKTRMNATEEQIKAMRDLADEQQRVGIFGNELILQGQQQLATFSNNAETVSALTESMANLVAQQKGFNATGGDFVNIANMMGKVLDGQTGALRRVGISFTDAQEEVLKYGNEVERANTLAEVITSNVGNMNKVLAQTPQGQWAQIRNEFNDLRKELGFALIPLMQRLIPITRVLISGLEMMGKGIGTLVEKYREMNPFLQAFVQGVLVSGALLPILATGAMAVAKAKLIWAGATTLLTKKVVFLNIALWKLALIGGAIAVVVKMIQEITGWGKKNNQVLEDTGKSGAKASKGINDIANAMSNLKKETMFLAGFDQITNIPDAESGSGLLGSLVGNFDDSQFTDLQREIDNLSFNSLESRWQNFWENWRSGVATIRSWFSQKMENIKLAWNNFWENWKDGWNVIKEWWIRTWSNLGNSIQETWLRIKTGWNNFWSNWASGWSSIRNWFVRTWQEFPNWIRNKFREIRTGWNNFWSNWRDGWGVIRDWWTRTTRNKLSFSNLFNFRLPSLTIPSIRLPKINTSDLTKSISDSVRRGLSGVGNFFGGFFATGGRPPLDRVSVVGERGPELFIPDQRGTIITNDNFKNMFSNPNNVINEIERNDDTPLNLTLKVNEKVFGEISIKSIEKLKAERGEVVMKI